MSDDSVSGAMFTIGYEQRTIDDFLQTLLENKIQVLVDVRLNPISRKRGFSKTALREALNEVGIEYRHERELGNPKDNREAFRQGLASARDRYMAHLGNGASAACDEVALLAQAERVALLCYERNHEECHRSCIVEKARADYPGMSLFTL